MIRAFDWRDVGLVKALGRHGICLDSKPASPKAVGPSPTRCSLTLCPARARPPWCGVKGLRPPLAKLRHRLGQEQARVLWVAPPCDGAADGWPPIVEQLAAEAGRRGAHNLIAEVREGGPEFEALRASGFGVYARQSVWKLSQPLHPAPANISLRSAVGADTLGVNLLYTNIVPRLVQQVEPPPAQVRGLVLEQKGELIAYLDVRQGPLGLWLDPYLHPEAFALSEAVIQAALGLLNNPAGLPVYVCVRRYQDWLQDLLAQTGFEMLEAQAMLVKRLAVRVTEPLLKPLPVVDNQATTPVVRARVTKHNN